MTAITCYIKNNKAQPCWLGPLVYAVEVDGVVAGMLYYRQAETSRRPPWSGGNWWDLFAFVPDENDDRRFHLYAVPHDNEHENRASHVVRQRDDITLKLGRRDGVDHGIAIYRTVSVPRPLMTLSGTKRVVNDAVPTSLVQPYNVKLTVTWPTRDDVDLCLESTPFTQRVNGVLVNECASDQQRAEMLINAQYMYFYSHNPSVVASVINDLNAESPHDPPCDDVARIVAACKAAYGHGPWGEGEVSVLP